MPRKGQITVFDGDTKVCRTCGEEKLIYKFPLRTDKKATRPHCKKCLNARANKSLAGYNARKKYDIAKKYGLSVKDFDEMLLRQQGLCAICRKTSKIDNRRLYVDHCHFTGKVRGLLCNTCNAGLGQFSDDLGLLEAAVDYLRKNGG